MYDESFPQRDGEEMEGGEKEGTRAKNKRKKFVRYDCDRSGSSGLCQWPLISIESELRMVFNETHRFESKWFFKLDRKFLRKGQQLQ